MNWTGVLVAVMGVFAMSSFQSSHSRADEPSPLEQIQVALAGDGVEGEVHGVRPEESVFVFTWRNPNDFFDFLHLSLVPETTDVAAALSKYGRHDRVRLKGKLLDLRSPQPHIEVSSVELVRAWNPSFPAPRYDYEVSIPEDLPLRADGTGRATFLVHAVHGDGKIVVLEYKDAVIPVFFQDPSLTKNLYRNDVVEFSYRIKARPESPAHLVPAPLPTPIKVLESALSKHLQPADLTGSLVLFPKSPQVSLDVYALHEEVSGGATRQYTLVNFDNPEVFKAIRAKCAEAWSKNPSEYRNGRNKLIHNSIKVRAKGLFNVVDPNQANVQILLNSADDLEIL